MCSFFPSLLSGVLCFSLFLIHIHLFCFLRLSFPIACSCSFFFVFFLLRVLSLHRRLCVLYLFVLYHAAPCLRCNFLIFMNVIIFNQVHPFIRVFSSSRKSHQKRSSLNRNKQTNSNGSSKREESDCYFFPVKESNCRLCNHRFRQFSQSSTLQLTLSQTE